jgi:biotin operon repressor
MFGFPSGYFYRNPPKVKVKHILPKIGEVEDFDIEWEFQGEIGDVDALADILGGEKGRGGEGGGGEEGPDREKLIEEYEEYLRELENVKSKEKRVTQDLITVFVDLHRVASEFGEMLGNLTKTLANLVYTTSPTLGALGEGLGAFGREMQGLGKAIGGIHQNMEKSVDNFRKAASALEMFQLRFPSGAPDLSQIQQGAQTAAAAAQTAGRLGMVIRGLQGIAVAAGPASIILLAFTQALVVFTQSLQILLPIVNTLLGILGNILQVIERGTQVMSVIERWRLAFSQFVEGAAAGEQAFNRFMSVFSRFGTTLDELARSLSNALGNIGIMAAQGRVSLEEWASLLGRIGQLGVRAGQQAEVLRAALEGRVQEAGGLGLPVETAESIAMLQYGIAGMGETATRTMAAMALLEMQIENLRQQSARAAQGTWTAADAIRAYNQIVGQLQTLYQDAGRILLERLAGPLQVFANVLQSSRVGEVIEGIAQVFGEFAATFLSWLEPFLVEIGNILSERMHLMVDTARWVGALLGDALGIGLKAIIDFITSPYTLAGLSGFAFFLNSLVDLLGGIVRVFGPPLMLILGAIATVAGALAKALGWLLEKFSDLTHWLGRILGIFGRRRESPEAEVRAQSFQQAIAGLNQALNDTGQSALFAKRSLEAVSEEARKFADNYRRIQQVMQEVSILFTPEGLGATWAPFQEFFRTFRQTTFLPPEVRRGLEEAGVLERRGGGILQPFARGQQPAIIRPEEELEFRIPRLQPISVGFAEWAGTQIQAALREIDARMTHLAATLATFNQEMMRTGYTINTSVIQAYQQLAQAFRNLVAQMENINRQTQEMIRGLRQAYEITETWLRLRWGLEDLRTAGAQLNNIVTASERLLTITRLRAEAQLIEVQRAAAMLGIITAMVRQQITSLRRAGVDIGIEPEQFDPLRMAPAQIAQIMQEARMPYFLINLTIQLTQALQEGWVTMAEIFRRSGEEIASVASSFRQLQGEITETAVRFGDIRGALQSGMWALISFGEELRGLGLKLTAALASNRIEEYYRVLQEGWRRFVEMFERSIDVIRRGLEAAFQPLNIHLDILERATRILERFGAQGLLLPEIFTKVIPEASRLLRLLEEMAHQYREHPYMLQMIFQVYETELNRLMGLLGQAAGGLVPAIPLSELIRISQLPILDPRQVARWAREGGPEVFAPEVRIMGAPFAPTYLLAWPVHMRGPTYLAAGPFGELARSVVGMGRLAAELETEEIRRQIGEIYRQFLLLPFERWRGEATQREQFFRERLPLVIQQTYEQNILGARAGLMRERVPLPGFEGVAPYQPILAIPPQAMEVPVRLRLQLDNNVIPLQIQIRKPDGGYETIEKRIEITPLDIARRNPPTTGTQ